jgi:2-polyprenyl-3-methyl-5-hydroxy-6-metoxy-1,4-benzoquinol methylase
MGDGQYFIKDDYRPNLGQAAYNAEDSRPYWDEQRIKKSAIYQYYVYESCRRLILKYGFERILDVGCGPAIKTKELLAPLVETVTLVDQPSIAEIVLHGVPTNACFVPANLESSEINLGKPFDLIICADVLEHIIDPNPCMQMIHRYLRPSGIAVLSTPERDNLHGIHNCAPTNPAHVREWNQKEFLSYIKNHSFEIVQHKLLPSEKISAAKFFISRCIPDWTRKKELSNCQMVVCRLP